MSLISIEKIVNETEFTALEEEWKRLFSASQCSPFLSFEWLSTWYKWFGRGAGSTLFVLKATRGGHLIGLLPLYRQEKTILGLKFIRLGLIGEKVGGADYLDFIARAEDKTEVFRSFFEYLKNENGFDLLCLENLSDSGETVALLQNSSIGEKKQNLRYAAETTEVCPKINLRGGWETVLKQSKRSSNFKRRLRQLEKLPGFEFRSVTAPDEACNAFERFYRLHEKRWEKTGGSELSGHPRLIAFQRDLIPQLARTGLLRFEELWVGGECRSSVYGLDDGNTFYYYNSGYDLQWANFSVGLVLIGLSVKSAVERGCAGYDFLRGEEMYKFEWANEATRLINVRLCRNTLPAKMDETKNLAWNNLRRLSKKALQGNFGEWLKGRRRQWKRNYRLSGWNVEKA